MIPTRPFRLLIAAGCVVLLAACTLQSTPAPVSVSEARPREEVQLDLAARLDEVRAGQEAVLNLWDRIIFGEQVSCEEAIPRPTPAALPTADRAAYPSADAIQILLDEAVQHVRDSADLWDIECSDPRDTVPLEMARDGRAAALAAGDALDAAADRLAAWALGGE